MNKEKFLSDYDATAATVKQNCQRGPYPGGKSEDFIAGQTRGIGMGLKTARSIIETIFDDPAGDNTGVIPNPQNNNSTADLENPPADAPLSVHLRGLARSMWPRDAIRPLLERCADALETAEAARNVVNEQAEDGGLWCIPVHINEDILQKALRRLHEAVEGKSPDDCARDALKKIHN